MLIDFNEIKEMTIPGMNNGTGQMSARMYISEKGKIIPTKIHPGGSIGLHTQMFTNVSYSSYDRGRKMEKPKRCAMIVTMGATVDQMRQIGYDQQFNYYGQQLGYMMGGRPAEMLYSNDAYQFTDYSKYNISVDRADPVQKKKHLAEEYPKDLEKAYELGRRLCQ